MRREGKAEVEQRPKTDLFSSSPSRVIRVPGPSPRDLPLPITLKSYCFFSFFLNRETDKRQTDRQSRSAHGACVGEAAGRLTAAMLRECRGLEVV